MVHLTFLWHLLVAIEWKLQPLWLLSAQLVLILLSALVALVSETYLQITCQMLCAPRSTLTFSVQLLCTTAHHWPMPRYKDSAKGSGCNPILPCQFECPLTLLVM